MANRVGGNSSWCAHYAGNTQAAIPCRGFRAAQRICTTTLFDVESPRMLEPIDPLELAYRELQLCVPVTEIGRKGDMIVLQIGKAADAAMAIAINDPKVPSYDVLYPKAAARPTGDDCLEASHMNRATLDFLRWIARQLLDHGAVVADIPE